MSPPISEDQLRAGVRMIRELARDRYQEYDTILHSTYTQHDILRPEFLPSGTSRRFGTVCPDSARLTAIAALNTVDNDEARDLFRSAVRHSPFEFEQSQNLRFIEVNNVCPDTNDPLRSLCELMFGLAFLVHREKSGDALVGIVRTKVLRHFLEVGMLLADSEPMNLLGDGKTRDHIVYFPITAPGAITYAAARESVVQSNLHAMERVRATRSYS